MSATRVRIPYPFPEAREGPTGQVQQKNVALQLVQGIKGIVDLVSMINQLAGQVRPAALGRGRLRRDAEALRLQADISLMRTTARWGRRRNLEAQIAPRPKEARRLRLLDAGREADLPQARGVHRRRRTRRGSDRPLAEEWSRRGALREGPQARAPELSGAARAIAVLRGVVPTMY